MMCAARSRGVSFQTPPRKTERQIWESITSFFSFSMSSVGMGSGRRERHEERGELALARHVLEDRLVDDQVAQGRELDLRAPQRARRGPGDHVAADRVVGAVAGALEAVLVAPPVRRAAEVRAA